MFRPSEDDFVCAGSHSDEPMHRADYKAKKFGRPLHGKKWSGFPGPRTGEEIGGGHFVFKRGKRTGRIENRGIPFEHGSVDSALDEAARLSVEYGGQFDVYSRVGGRGEVA